jgi:sugar/nucleoside kinase (ribokinase family)
LAAGDIPIEWLRSPIVHLAPMAQEVDPTLASDFGGAFVGVTPQGWLREWDEQGRVRNDPAVWTSAEQVLGQANAVVTSLEDLQGDWAVAERWARWGRTLVVTRGAEGCTVFVKGEGARDFLAPRVEQVDPTGAGDIFAAAFFVNYYETGDPWASARFANQVGALSVTRVGLEGVPTREEAGYCRTRAASAT